MTVSDEGRYQLLAGPEAPGHHHYLPPGAILDAG
jgi:hypothetical protein